MDTKSKKIRRSAGVKTTAFLWFCVALCVVLWQLFSIAFSVDSVFDSGANIAMEAVLEKNYVRTSAYAREVSSAAWVIVDALEASVPNQSSKVLIDDKLVYYAFYSSSPASTVSNTTLRSPEEFDDFSPYSYLYENSQLTAYYAPTQYLNNYIAAEGGREITLYFSFLPDYINTQQYEWLALRNTIMPRVIIALAALLSALIAVVFLSFVTGRRPGSDELFLSPLDSIYSDILLCLILGFGIAWFGLGVIFNSGYRYYSSGYAASVWFTIVLTALCTPCILALWLSCMRKIKARRFLRHSLIYAVFNGIRNLFRWIFRGIGSFFSNLFSGRRFEGYPFARMMFRRQSLFIGLSVVMVFFFSISILSTFYIFPAFFFVVGELVLVYFYVKANNNNYEDIERLTNQVQEIYQGNMDFDPGVSPGSHLHPTVMQLRDVGSGMERALNRQLQSERMKIALVTNVSHDLKTPLTSIIGYIDLLSRDESLSPEARDYVTILTNKSQRLKSIIEDLFDLAKTTSGDDTSLNMEVLDLRRLIEQTLADMEDKIERSGQVVRTTLTDMPVFARADGRKLYRVIQNVMDNALKYSMPGTRIFVSLSSNVTHARMVFKNTASYEMDFTADEVLERFVRGDKSRSTEGSGLGLSIAQGFTKALGGNLQVGVDGDQFRVEITFDICNPPSADGPVPEEEPVPPGFEDRMSYLKGKLYRPREGQAPTVITPPVADGHFEPERPVEIDELESLLDAFEHADWPKAPDAPPPGEGGDETPLPDLPQDIAPEE